MPGELALLFEKARRSRGDKKSARNLRDILAALNTIREDTKSEGLDGERRRASRAPVAHASGDGRNLGYPTSVLLLIENDREWHGVNLHE